MLAGAPPPGCQACGLTWRELSERTAGQAVTMFLHPKDGILQVLCAKCSDAYERKRLDLYGATPYGLRRRLAGAK